MTASKRRWFRFGLRTLFVVMAVIAVWLGWSINRIVQRHRELARADVSFELYAPEVIRPATAPWLLWIFGEPSYCFVMLRFPDRPGGELTETEIAEMNRLQRLFPEAAVGYYGPDDTNDL